MQPFRKLVDTQALTISYDNPNEWLYIEWKGDHDKTTVRTGFELILRCLQAWECKKILNDSSQVTSSWEVAAEVLNQNFFDCLVQQSVRYVAWVYSPQWSNRRAIDARLQFVARPIVIMFEELATAYAWLKQSL
ncbi:hypothetical protein [Hymenobacter cavernae]|uniref:STAS/SEC14 domain-containing protein n=1 Tax=Hymenobacter cavernae TaxID=2044852 RepID=A0ABQ1U5V6_9BACT|nr:hypothetical protein [Hymenobacter cavernae]GGF11053.1 hypothetical protein GCM10011383_22800 [Hymenobacter cavernae]